MNKEIVILGCGMSGMLTALALADYGIKTIVIESKATSDTKFCHDMRTIALTASSKLFLKKLNIWSDLKDLVAPLIDIYVLDNKAPEMLHFPAKMVDKDAVGYMIKAVEFKKILLSKIKNNPLITLRDKCTYQKVETFEDHCDITLEGETIITDLLILCDGAVSKLRNQYFLNTIQRDYHQRAITFYIKHEKKHEGTAVEHFMFSGGLAILPLPDQFSSSIVWTIEEKFIKPLMNLPKEEFEHILQKNCGDFLGKISIDSEIGIFPLRAQVAEKYFYQRLVLVADSAHTIHPLSGQGLNQGIKDIELLTGLISNGITNDTLSKYEHLRQNDNKAMYAITNVLNNLFSNYSTPLWHLRRAGLFAIDNIKPLKKRLIEYAMGRR